MKKQRNKRFCGDCIHCSACSAQCAQNLYETDATHCVNYEKLLTDINLIKAIEQLGAEKNLKIWTIGVRE
jgi:sulfatase maturation enzyme AslB (radical SAM superfamily)